jgi:hypothetical protein
VDGTHILTQKKEKENPLCQSSTPSFEISADCPKSSRAFCVL